MEKIFFKINCVQKTIEAYRDNQKKIGSLKVPDLMVHETPKGQILSHRIIKAIDFNDYLQLSIQKIGSQGNLIGDVFYEKIFPIDQQILESIQEGFSSMQTKSIEELILALEQSGEEKGKIKKLQDAKGIISGITQIYSSPDADTIEDLLSQIEKFEKNYEISFAKEDQLKNFGVSVREFQEKMGDLFIGDLTDEKKENILSFTKRIMDSYPESKEFFSKKESFLREVPTFSIELSQEVQVEVISKVEEIPVEEILEPEEAKETLPEKEELKEPSNEKKSFSASLLVDSAKKEEKKEAPDYNKELLDFLKENQNLGLQDTNRVLQSILAVVHEEVLTKERKDELEKELFEEKERNDLLMQMKQAKTVYKEEKEILEEAISSYLEQGSEKAAFLLNETLSYLKENITNSKAKNPSDYDEAVHKIHTSLNEAELLHRKEEKEMLLALEDLITAIRDPKYDSYENISEIRDMIPQEKVDLKKASRLVRIFSKEMDTLEAWASSAQQEKKEVLFERTIGEDEEEEIPLSADEINDLKIQIGKFKQEKGLTEESPSIKNAREAIAKGKSLFTASALKDQMIRDVNQMAESKKEVQRLLAELSKVQDQAVSLIQQKGEGNLPSLASMLRKTQSKNYEDLSELKEDLFLLKEALEEGEKSEDIIPLEDVVEEGDLIEEVPAKRTVIPKKDPVLRPASKLSKPQAKERLEALTDISSSNEYYQFIGKCIEFKVLRGFQDGTFQPTSEISNTNLVLAAAALLPDPEVEDFEIPIPGITRDFRAYDALKKAIVYGLVDETKPFDPSAPASRATAFTFMQKIARYKPLSIEEANKILSPYADTAEIPEEEKRYVAALVKDGKIKPTKEGLKLTKPVLRSEVAVIFGALLHS